MMSYDKSDIRFELSVCENLLLVKKMQKIEIWRIFLGTNDLDLYLFCHTVLSAIPKSYLKRRLKKD